MASGQFFDPLTLLRVAPLVTTSFSVWFSVDQYLFFRNFIIPPNRVKGSELLPPYWRSFLPVGLSVVFSLYGSSIATGIANYRSSSPASLWYGLGAALAACHFLFVPAAAPKIRAMIDDESKGQSWRAQEKWLTVHTVRSLLVDVPSWACFLVAVMEGLKAV